MRVAFLGFSEAGPAFAEIMIAHGAEVSACDPAAAHRPALRARAEALGVPLSARPEEALAGAALVVSTVTAAAAVTAARDAAPSLGPGCLYLDLNSCGPATKAAVAEVVAPTGAGFCEGAALGLVAGAAERVPILLSGPEASRATAALRALGVNATDLGPAPGAASTAKLLRSVFVKGLEALLDETVAAAEAAGVRGAVMASLADTFSGRDFPELAAHHIGRLRSHGVRRAEELREAATLLQELGVDPVVTRAAAVRQARADHRPPQEPGPDDRSSP